MYAERHFYVLSYAHAVPVLITPHGRVARRDLSSESPQRPGARTPRAGRRATAHPVGPDLIPCAWGVIPLDARIAEIGKSNDPNPPLTERVACRRIVATSRSLTLVRAAAPGGCGESASAAQRGEGAELPRPPLGPSARFPGLMVMLRGVSCGAVPSLSFCLPKSPRGPKSKP